MDKQATRLESLCHKKKDMKTKRNEFLWQRRDIFGMNVSFYQSFKAAEPSWYCRSEPVECSKQVFISGLLLHLSSFLWNMRTHYLIRSKIVSVLISKRMVAFWYSFFEIISPKFPVDHKVFKSITSRILRLWHLRLSTVTSLSVY